VADFIRELRARKARTTSDACEGDRLVKIIRSELQRFNRSTRTCGPDQGSNSTLIISLLVLIYF
jgi:hypothetical protein